MSLALTHDGAGHRTDDSARSIRGDEGSHCHQSGMNCLGRKDGVLESVGGVTGAIRLKGGAQALQKPWRIMHQGLADCETRRLRLIHERFSHTAKSSWLTRRKPPKSSTRGARLNSQSELSYLMLKNLTMLPVSLVTCGAIA